MREKYGVESLYGGRSAGSGCREEGIGDMPARWNGKCTGDDVDDRKGLNGEQAVEAEPLPFRVDAMSVDGDDHIVPVEFLDGADQGRG